MYELAFARLTFAIELTIVYNRKEDTTHDLFILKDGKECFHVRLP